MLTKIQKGGEAEETPNYTDVILSTESTESVVAESPEPMLEGEQSPSDIIELDRQRQIKELILEQAKDDTSYIAPENGTLHFLGVGNDSKMDLFEAMDMDNVVDLSAANYSCAYHGKELLVRYTDGTPRCRICERENNRKYRRQRGQKEQAVCPHGSKRKVDCKECRRAWNKASRNNWYKTEKGKAYLKRKRDNQSKRRSPEKRHEAYERAKAKDPDFLAKGRERNRLYRERRKSAAK